MKIVGIDFSSNAIDLVLVDLDDTTPPEWHRYTLDGQDAFDRTRAVAAAMPSRTAELWEDVLAVGIEHPAGKFGVGPMMRVQGAVLACLPNDVLVKAWPPGAWRKAVGLAGNATKADVKVFADAMIPRRDPDHRPTWVEQDAADAYCIALATRQALEIGAAA